MRTWKKRALHYLMKYTAGSYPNAPVQKKRRRKPRFIEFYHLFRITGKYYLYKLYFLEYIESINQISNMFNIYMCSLETLPLLFFCMILALDGLLRGWFLRQVHSPSRRLKQVVATIVDFICIAFPLGYLLCPQYFNLVEGDNGYCIVALSLCVYQNAINFQRNHAHEDGQISTEGKG